MWLVTTRTVVGLNRVGLYRVQTCLDNWYLSRAMNAHSSSWSVVSVSPTANCDTPMQGNPRSGRLAWEERVAVSSCVGWLSSLVCGHFCARFLYRALIRAHPPTRRGIVVLGSGRSGDTIPWPCGTRAERGAGTLQRHLPGEFCLRAKPNVAQWSRR